MRFLEAILIAVASGIALEIFLSKRRLIKSQFAEPELNQLTLTFNNGRVIVIDTEGFFVKSDSLTT